jgi:hypothetical protein
LQGVRALLAIFAISAIVHVIMLCAIVGAGSRPFAPVSAEPIFVNLVPEDDIGAEPGKPKASEPAKQPAKSDPQTGQDPAAKAAAVPDPANDPQASAARLERMFDEMATAAILLRAPPSEIKANLSAEEIARFKAQVGKCFASPPGIPNTPGFEVLIRVAFNPNGTLKAEPEHIRAPAAIEGPALVNSAKQALRQCQPYNTLPVDRYKDWKVLDVSFTANGPSVSAAMPRAAQIPSR